MWGGCCEAFTATNCNKVVSLDSWGNENPPTQIKEEKETAVQTIEHDSILAEKQSLVATPLSVALASVSLFDLRLAWQGSGNRTNGKASNSFGLCYVTGKTYPTNSFKGSSHGAQAPKWIGNWLSLSLKLLRQHSQPQGNNSIREAAGTFPPSSLPMVSTYLWPFHAARWLKGSAHSHLILWFSHVFIP